MFIFLPHHRNTYNPSDAWNHAFFHPLFLKLGLRTPFLEQGSNIEYSRINLYRTKVKQFVQRMVFINSKGEDSTKYMNCFDTTKYLL